MEREEAIKKIRQMSLPKDTMEILEALAPELKESEDERIRKWLIDYFKNVGNTWIHREISPEQILSYLEKQKDHFRDDTKMVEQKPADDKAFEKWIDDWWKHNKVNNPDSYDKGDEIQFDKRGFKNFCRGIRNMYSEQKPAEWQKAKTLEDAVEIEVKEDAGGYPIVPLDAIELYDYENDKSLAKAGDKVRVIVIKED